MCCLVTSLFLLGPRFAALVWWFINPVRFSLAFGGWILPILGIIFVPWTTIIYLVVWSPVAGISGLDWLWLGLGLLADLGTYAGGGFGNRERIPGYGA